MKRAPVILAIAAVSVAAGAGMLAWRATHRPAATGPVAAVAPGARTVDMVVCYPSRSGGDPVEETRRKPEPASPQDRFVQLVAEMHSPPASAQALPLFPPGLAPRAVFLAGDGVAYIDEPAAALDRPLGASDEIAFVRSILRGVAMNCPEIKAVVFLVDGAARNRLCAHLPAHGRYLVPKLAPARTP